MATEDISKVITVIIILSIIGLSFYSVQKNKDYKNEIVSLGVLGTFIGIIIGLFNFNVNDLESSIPNLLNGLKTAFITSGVGIFSSIFISLYKNKNNTQNEMQTLIQNQEKMILTLEQSLKYLSKKANSEMVSALQKIVTEFNDNLNEQFGDNFKELNFAVKNMITWQENYKNQIKSNEENLIKISNELKELSKIKENQEKNIEKVIKNLDTSSDALTQNLEKSVEIVKESLDMLLREANAKI